LWEQRAGFSHERFRVHTEDEFRKQLEKLGRSELASAHQTYGRIFDLNRNSGWALAQSISLSLALNGSISYDDFQTAWTVNRRDRGHQTATRRSWALASLAELSLVRAAFQKLHPNPDDTRWRVGDEATSETALCREFENYLENLMLLATELPNEVRSSLLQFKRLQYDLLPMAGQTRNWVEELPEIAGAMAVPPLAAGKSKSAGKKVVGGKTPKAATHPRAPLVETGELQNFVKSTIGPLMELPGLRSYR
jgi:hypothetical protein